MNDVWTAFTKGDNAKLYSMLGEDIKKDCSFQEFLGQMVLANAFMGDSFKKSKLEISNVRIAGNRATYDSKTTLDGDVLNEEKGQVLVWDGKKWVEESGENDPDEDCS